MTERERRSRIIGYLRAGKAEDAANELAHSRESYPGDGVLYHAIGLAFASRGTLGRAREQLEAAVKLSPDSAEILSDLAQVYLADGQADEGVHAAEEALAVEPDLPIAHFTLGRACFVTECARQARRPESRESRCEFPLIDGRTPLYLRAQQEMETALYASPPFLSAVRSALSFAYLRAGHYHAATEQLTAQLSDLPPGDESDRTRARLHNVEREIIRERYWAIEEHDMAQIEREAEAADASAEAKLRLAHACAVLDDEESLAAALEYARAAGYEPRAAHVSRDAGAARLHRHLSDVHVLIAGGLECIVDERLRFLPFRAIESVTFGPAAAWRAAQVALTSGDAVEALVPSLYRLSVRSPNDLIQTGRFTQFKYAPGETRYAHAVGTRNLATEDGVIPFPEIEAIVFG